jgi:hypothetical protein
MDKFLVFFQSQGIKLLFDEILNRLYIVVRDLFNLFDGLRIFRSKLLIDFLKFREFFCVKIGQLWQWNFTKRDEIFNFHLNSVLDEGLFGKIILQAFGLASIPAING